MKDKFFLFGSDCIQRAICTLALAFSISLANGQSADLGHKGAFFETEVSIEVEQGDQGVVVQWDYVNLLEDPMVVDRIEGLDESLDTEDLHLMSANWRRGSSITATFKPGKEPGVIRKSIFVYFTNCSKPVELVLEAKVLKEGKKPAVELAKATWDPVAAVQNSSK